MSTKLLTNRIDTVDSSYFKTWIRNAQEKRFHVFQLFTERSSTSPILMSLANDFKDFAMFAEVRDDNDQLRKFKQKTTPSFIYISDPVEYKCEVYDQKYYENKNN